MTKETLVEQFDKRKKRQVIVDESKLSSNHKLLDYA